VAFVGISAIALATLWAFYGFRYAARGEGLTLNPPLVESIRHLSRPPEVRLLETVASYHLLPESYVYGLADVPIMSDFYTSYLFGEIYPHGTWFCFPAALRSNRRFRICSFSARLQGWLQLAACDKQLVEALAEGQQSLALAPDAVKPDVLVGDILVALQHPDEARPYYEKALTLATTVEPEFQIGWVNALQEKLRAK
jgi:hypothetical protein